MSEADVEQVTVETMTRAVSINGEVWLLTTHWARREDGRVIPVGMDLRSFAYEADPADPSRTVTVPASESAVGRAYARGHRGTLAGGWHELRTTTLRGVSVPAEAAEARATLAGRYAWHGQDPGGYAQQGRTRGPEPAVPDEVVRDIAVPAYLVGGSEPVEAVRLALEGWKLGAGRASHTTRGEAANVVRRARRRGWLSTQRKGTK